MRFEPPVDRPGLQSAIEGAYGFGVRELTFVPASSSAACYALATDSDVGYFVKLWLELRLDGPEAAGQLASLAITRALQDRDAGLQLPYPVRTRDGALWADVSGVPFAVFPYLPGKPLAGPWPLALSRALGRAVAATHGATSGLSDVLPSRETLDIGFEPALRRNLVATTQMGPDSRAGLLGLRRWAMTRQEDIVRQLARLHGLQIAAHQRDVRFVLCHTDLHQNNLLVTDDGTLSILDWDDVKMAPPEHDLWCGLGEDYRGEAFDVFLDAYRESGGTSPLYREHFAFYLLRRYLDDLHFGMSGMLKADADEREDTVRLHGLEECYDRWTRLDATLATISAVL